MESFRDLFLVHSEPVTVPFPNPLVTLYVRNPSFDPNPACSFLSDFQSSFQIPTSFPISVLRLYSHPVDLSPTSPPFVPPPDHGPTTPPRPCLRPSPSPTSFACATETRVRLLTVGLLSPLSLCLCGVYSDNPQRDRSRGVHDGTVPRLFL